jgi:hypothetical protein
MAAELQKNEQKFRYLLETLSEYDRWLSRQAGHRRRAIDMTILAA